MPLRCVYTDLDGTLLGAGASLFRTGAGEFTLLPARALEVCHRAGVEVVLMSGRRKAQVMEDARLIGQSAYVFEIGAGVVIDGAQSLLCGDFAPREGRTPHQLIDASGAPELLIDRYGATLESHDPWHRDRFVSHLFRGRLDLVEANRLLADEGPGGLVLIDNGSLADGRRVYHLIPEQASKRAGVELHMRARAYVPHECVAVGDSAEDMTVAKSVGRFFLVANATDEPVAGVERTEQSNGDGFYEAVVRSLAEMAE